MARPPDSDDGELIARSAAGDVTAFEALFDRKHRAVFLVAYQILGDAVGAEEVAQEVFIRLWKHAADFRGGRLDPWLRRITTNRAIDHWRRRRTDSARRVEPAAGGDPDRLLEAVGERQPGLPAPDALHGGRQLQAIWDELAELLPVRQRAAFVLREIEGATGAEVAEILGCDVSTVRSHIAGARVTLRRALRERYPELLRAAGAPDRR